MLYLLINIHMPRITSITSQTLTGLGLGITSASVWQLAFTLDNPNAFGTSDTDEFGKSISVSGNYAIVGARFEDEADGTLTGKAYIFDVRTGALVHTLDNPNAEGTVQGDYFGWEVAISGDRAIVGAPGEDDPGRFNRDSGKAYIFNVTTGVLVHTLNNPNAFGDQGSDKFGETVAISGNYAIVGATEEDDAGGLTSGKAYIFDVTTGALAYTLDNPTPFGTSQSDLFACSVAISTTHAIVGARGEDDADGTSSGKAYIFDLTDGSLLQTLDNPNAFGTSAADNFGISVAISGNRAIVGAVGEDEVNSGSGIAYIFNVTTGALVHTLNNPDAYEGTGGDSFGQSVAISGNRAIVGAWAEDDDNGTQSGKAYTFDVTTGELTDTLDNPNAYATSQNDYFGWSVAISDTHAVVSAYLEDEFPSINSSGKAYIFQGQFVPQASGTWTDDNGDPVTVAGIVSPIAMQVNGVFAQNPAVPFDIEGATSGATTTITNIAANTGTLLELDDDGNSTSFTVGEQLNIV